LARGELGYARPAPLTFPHAIADTFGSPPRRLWLRRVGWFVLLWTTSRALPAIVALSFRALMKLAGMTV